MKAKILSNREAAPGYFRLAVSATEALLRGRPGQFVMVRGEGWETDPLLRRPFSIYRFRKGMEAVEILYRAVGRGTRLLSQMKAGDAIDILGPLGNGFPDLPEGRRSLLVAGGAGVAPLISVAEAKGGSARLIMGGKTKDDISYVFEDERELGIDVTYATEDGSFGKMGTSISAMKEEASPGDTVFACGPLKMLREVERLSREMGFTSYVSYEERMGCGTGLCFGCVVMGAGGEYQRVCKDGPVFDVNELSWKDIEDID
ncbi:MAG: dihydroorotate dehydrogenase electron transfer subunit [Deltaproteobacteria bacterium]|uniref:Dihydroorotate dehydrogenase electron transfer subunit n=1 Tax=Candidatus Zymogenus saltonus TaxID=2844893 RepID=A0A9D8KFU6_9DELT|nr:dihydroorotate dehydrogenase electron transfer subunit [Candidatus Zymogenus saltonus]